MSTTGRNFGSDNRRPAVLVDFDDTAAAQNVAEMLLSRFGHPTWQDVRERFRASELTLNEYQEITFRNIQADLPTMQGYVKDHASLRPYFKELWNYCQAQDIPMAIVSQGLDFYIQALLQKEGVAEVPVYSVNTEFTPQGITYQYRYTRPGEERRGNSKGLLVDQFRERGHYVFYAGDGISDFEAASRADLLFAHRTLAQECDRNNIPFRLFTDFQDMLLAVQEYDLQYHADGRRSGRSPHETSNPGGSEEGGA